MSHVQLLGSPGSSSGGGGGNNGSGMSGSTSPISGILPANLSSTSPTLNSSGSAGGTTNSCCEGGRPLVTDPVTGQSVCSCQYDASRLSSLTASAYPRLSAYGSGPYAPPNDQNPYPSLDSSAFYSPLGGGAGEGLQGSWGAPGLQGSAYYGYDPTFAAAAYGYGGGYDLAARRKNATRESTATLKAWLGEHKKNPYPTKGEKIMLAIITKMTLTQVSTWFANARRRLKKENKMTWEPKNKTDEEDDDKDDDDDDPLSPQAPSPTSNHHHHQNHHLNNNTIKSDLHLTSQNDLKMNQQSRPDCSGATKPKIWSLADTAACKTPPPIQNHYTNASMYPPPGSGHHHHSSSGQSHLSMPMNNHQNNYANHQINPPPPVTSSWSFPLPYGRYGSFLPPMAGGGSEIGTETPPQTPPNLKVPISALYSNNSSINHHHHQGPTNHHHLQPHLHHHNNSSIINHGLNSELTNTAFKPVLKSSSGGFCV